MYDSIPHYALKFFRRKVYPCFFTPHELPPLECEEDLDKSNEIIYNTLEFSKSCMIARIGASEMNVMTNWHFIKGGKRPIFEYISGKGGEWWWNIRSVEQLKRNSGVFPASLDIASRFAELSISDLPQIDVLGSWLAGEKVFASELSSAKKVQLFNLEPFFANNPWTKYLEGKKVLVVHPFAKTIEMQYEKRELLFKNKDILPKFELVTYKAVQSIGGEIEYKDWFDALEKMENDIDKIDYDIAIIGCGAYGLSLAAHIKRSGKKAVHLGGVTQILFGIIGKRWENPTRAMCINGSYPNLMNEYWCRPSKSETPNNANKVEGACYW